MQPSNMKFNGIVIHHSATKDGQTKSWNAIRNYHMQTNGWSEIGYHFGLEDVDGAVMVMEGRSLKYKGAHCPPNDMIGICVVGDYDKEAPSDDKLSALRVLCVSLCRQFKFTPDMIFPHSQFSTKTCPGKLFPFAAWKETVKAAYQEA